MCPIDRQTTRINQLCSYCIQSLGSLGVQEKGKEGEEKGWRGQQQPYKPYGFPLYNPKPLPKYEGLSNCHSILHQTSLHHFWIIDSSALEHIIGNAFLFQSLHKCTSFPISLPTGETHNVQYKGDIAVTSDLILHNVYYIPSFHVNLLFVSRLIAYGQYLIQFTK